jgi:hypothetical protein
VLILPRYSELEAERLRRSLPRFVRSAWPLLEPATQFREGWHLDALCEALEAVARGELRRLIINVPPRHMKSLAAAVFFPCWLWLSRPEARLLYASYSQALSIRDSLKCRRLIEADGTAGEGTLLERLGYRGLLLLLGEDWGLAGDQRAKQRFENSRTGYRLATSVGGTATGEGGDLLVIDDPHKADEVESEVRREAVLDWHDATMATRLNDPQPGAEVVIMQRLHERDLTGHLLEQGGFELLCLPAEYEPGHRPLAARPAHRARRAPLARAVRTGGARAAKAGARLLPGRGPAPAAPGPGRGGDPAPRLVALLRPRR